MRPKFTEVSSLAIVAFVVAILFSGAAHFSASAAIQKDNPEVAPPELSGSEYEELVEAALSDVRLQEQVKGMNYEVMSYDFIGDSDETPFVWYPELHIKVGNEKQITVVMTKAASAIDSTVSKIVVFPLLNSAQAVGADTNHGFATNYYTGGSTINGLRLSTSAPTIQTTSDKGMAWLLNAVALNTDDSKACNAAFYGSNYFGQVGFAWAWNGFVTWSDTAVNCGAQLPAVTYSPGASYDFKIYVTGGNWVLYGKNLSTNEVFTKTRSGITYGVMKTSNYNTSVFLETQTSSPAGSQFTSSPSGTATMSTNGGSSWSNWQSGARNDQSCSNVNHIYSYDATKEVISGNLASGGSATWNTVRMATNYPSC